MGSKITTDGDYSHEFKRFCFSEEKLSKPRQHIKRQRHHFAEKVHIVKTMVCLAVMYGCESMTIKVPEHQRIDAFELLEKTLESLLDRKEISPKYSLQGQMLKLKLQYLTT